MLYGEAIRLPNQISLFSDFMVKPNLSCVSSLLVNTRPGSGPRREGRPPRAHGRGGQGSNMYYTTSIHMSIGPTATGCRSLGSAYGKELKRRVIHPSSRRFASQTSCSCLFLAAAARPPGVRPTVRRRWCLAVR